MLLEVPAPPVRATEVSVRDATDGDAAAWRDYVAGLDGTDISEEVGDGC